jgi:hypothetical protein
MREPLFIT